LIDPSDEMEVPDDFESVRELMKAEYARDHGSINPDRWQRIRNGAVVFSEIVELLTGRRGSMISCPFHGRDRTPSFAIYPPSKGNCGYCFGCSTMFDAFKFVADIHGWSKVRALQWIEKTFELPPMEGVEDDEEEEESEEEVIQLGYEDLTEPFIVHAKKAIQEANNLELAENFMRIYFQAERDQSALLLARVLGRDSLQEIAKKRHTCLKKF
jgi:CHC2 zinc finger